MPPTPSLTVSHQGSPYKAPSPTCPTSPRQTTLRYLLQLVSGTVMVVLGIASGTSCGASAMADWLAYLALIGGGALLGLGLARLFGEGERVEVEMEYRDRLQEARRRLANTEREAAELATALAARERQTSNLIAELGALRARLGDTDERTTR